MDIYGWNEKVIPFSKKHGESVLLSLFEGWKDQVSQATATNFHQLKQQVGHNPDTAKGHIVFNVNSFRLIAFIPFSSTNANGIPPCVITSVFTHKEYDRWSRQ